MKGKVLGPVAHFFYKKEYQARGAPHYHILLWIEDAPIAGRDDSDVLRWIQNRITCRIPEEDSNPELHQLVTKYQSHRCSGYCQRRKRVKSTYITYCRFGFPRQTCESATLKSTEECLNSSRRQMYRLPRSPEEIRINNFNPLLLILWNANMDIQYIGESSLAITQYVTGYVTKAEKSNMQDIWQEVSSHQSLYSKLWSFGVRSLRSRESFWGINCVENYRPSNGLMYASLTTGNVGWRITQSSKKSESTIQTRLIYSSPISSTCSILNGQTRWKMCVSMTLWQTTQSLE